MTTYLSTTRTLSRQTTKSDYLKFKFEMINSLDSGEFGIEKTPTSTKKKFADL